MDVQMYLYKIGDCIFADHNCMSKSNGKKEFWRPEEFRSQRDDKDSLLRLWQRVRSPLQAHRRKAGLLQGLPAQAPETPVLIP